MVMKYGAKKDANHHEIVDALKKAGISVIDVSTMGGGFPDLIVYCRGKTMLAEIKNPKTGYGKRGANKLQVVWAENWPAPVYLITSLEDVEAFANGVDIPMICPR